jgi:hypothetical protein
VQGHATRAANLDCRGYRDVKWKVLNNYSRSILGLENAVREWARLMLSISSRVAGIVNPTVAMGIGQISRKKKMN